MRKCFLLFSLIFIITQSSFAKNISILWWNVENLFDTTDDPKTRDTILTKEEFNKKVDLISDKLIELDADIIGFAEVENIFVVETLAKRSNYPFFYLEEGNDIRGIDVCLLSKYSVEYISHKDQPTPYKENKHYKFSRDCPEAFVKIDNKEIYILLNHLKSMVGDKEKTLKKRNSQAMGILDIVSGIYKKNSTPPFLIIMGDMNSLRYSEPLNILQKSGLIILNYKYNENNIYTYNYKGRKNDLDYIILNETIQENIKVNSFESLRSKDYNSISDHYPLLLKIELIDN